MKIIKRFQKLLVSVLAVVMMMASVLTVSAATGEGGSGEGAFWANILIYFYLVLPNLIFIIGWLKWCGYIYQELAGTAFKIGITAFEMQFFVH